MIVLTPDISTHALKRLEKQIIDTVPDDLVNRDFSFGIVINHDQAVSLAENHNNLILLNACYYDSPGSDEKWRSAWRKSLAVVSYLDLQIEETKFIRTPISFDPNKFFFKASSRKRGSALVTGFIDGYPSEEIVSVGETFSPTYHLGPDFSAKIKNKGYVNLQNIPDGTLNNIYNQVEFVAGMRHIEGFEMPVIEGMACGATPIVLDLPCYRHWFDGMAMFVDPNKDIPDQLKKIKSSGGMDESLLIQKSYQFRQDIVWNNIWKELRDVLQDVV